MGLPGFNKLEHSTFAVVTLRGEKYQKVEEGRVGNNFGLLKKSAGREQLKSLHKGNGLYTRLAFKRRSHVKREISSRKMTSIDI